MGKKKRLRRGGMQYKIPDIIIKAKGTFTLPPLTAEDLTTMRNRADAPDVNQELKTIVYKLIHEVRRLNNGNPQ